MLGAGAVQGDVTPDHIKDVEPRLDLGWGVSAHAAATSRGEGDVLRERAGERRSGRREEPRIAGG
jgi:hypothetical protein